MSSSRERGGPAREERRHAPGPVRSERPMFKAEGGRPPREGERERGRGEGAEGRPRHIRRQRNEEEDVSSYEYVNVFVELHGPYASTCSTSSSQGWDT